MEKLMAIVNGKEIYEKDVDQFIAMMGQRGQHFNNEEGKKKICDELINQELLIEDAFKIKLDETEIYEKEIENAKRSILANLYVGHLFSSINITDEDLKAYYENHKEEFKTKYMFSAKHILVESEEKAKELKTEIDNGKTFEDLAKEHSMCPSKEVGGDLGEFSQGQMVVEFEKACIEANIGEVTEPVKTQFGYHLVKVESKKEPEVIEFERVKEEIRKNLLKEAEQQVYLESIKKLAENSNIERKY